jgi:hypothetical protein
VRFEKNIAQDINTERLPEVDWINKIYERYKNLVPKEFSNERHKQGPSYRNE